VPRFFCVHWPKAIAAIKLWLGVAIFSESCIFMYFSTFLENVVKSAKLPNLGSMWPNIGPTQAQHGRKMAQRPQHRTYGFIDWNSGANTLVRAVVIAKRPEYQQSKLRIFFYLEKFHRCSEDKGITPWGTQLRNDGYLLYMLVTIILFILSKQIVICSDLYLFCLFHIDFCFDDHEFLSYPFCICSHLPSRGPRQKIHKIRANVW